jgi:hypothetical protein
MQQELYHLIRRFCKTYEIRRFEDELFLHDSTKIKYATLTLTELDRFISLVTRYWDYLAYLTSNLSYYEETTSQEFSDRIPGVLDIGRTLKLRANNSSKNVVCSVNVKNIYSPENTMLAVILLGINILATKFTREIKEDLPILVKYLPLLSRIMEYSGLLLKNRPIRKLSEFYLLNYKNLQSLVMDTHNQISRNKFREKYYPLLHLIKEWVKYEYIINTPTKSQVSAITAYLDKLRTETIYEIWIFYKLLELFEPMRQSAKYDHKVFFNDEKGISIEYQASSKIGWTIQKAEFNSSVLRRPDVLIKQNGHIKALVDAKYMIYQESDEETGIRGPDRNIVNQMIIYLDYIGPSDMGIVLFADPKQSQDISVKQRNRKIVFLNCYPYTNSSNSTLDKVREYILET